MQMLLLPASLLTFPHCIPLGPSPAHTVHWYQDLVLFCAGRQKQSRHIKVFLSSSLCGCWVSACPRGKMNDAFSKQAKESSPSSLFISNRCIIVVIIYWACVFSRSDLIPQDIFCIYLESSVGELLSHCLPCSGCPLYSVLAGAGRTSWVLFGHSCHCTS